MRTRKWRRRKMLALLFSPLLAVSFLSLVPAPASAADDCGVPGNIVTNCGFETGDLTGWAKIGDPGYTNVGDSGIFGPSHTGTYKLYAGPQSEGGLTQTLTTVAGTAYDVGVWLRTDTGSVFASDYVIVDVDPDGSGPAGWSTPVVNVPGPASTTYSQHTGTFTAEGSEAYLRLRYLNYNDYWLIDDVSVASVSTDPIDNPVPSSMIVSYNGLEWVWASPVAADSSLTDGVLVGKDGFNFATAAQWALRPAASAFGGTMCAAPWFDKTWDHCDWGDPDNGYFGSALTGGLPAGADGTVPMSGIGETWLVRVPVTADVATSTALASNHNPSVFGQSVDLTATVTPDSGSDVPTGTVEFWEGANKLGEDALNSSGVATVTVSDFAVGSHFVIAKYVPDAGFVASESDALEQVVNKADTSTVINSVTPAHPTYGQTLSFDTTVAPVAPGDGTPTGAVTYKVNKFAGTPEATGYVDFDPATDLLPAGTHHVEALYAGDDNFNGSRSNAFVVTVDQAETTVSYLGDYLAILGNAFTFKANVDSPVAGCRVGRDVTFTLLDGSTEVESFTATSGAGGAVTKTVSTTGWPTGAYDVLVEVAESSDGNCATADNSDAMDVVTVASPGDAATGGGWYFWKDSGPGKRVNFGFTVSKQADNSYQGSLLLMNQGFWRIKANLDSFTRTDAQGQAGGTGTLYQWVCTDQGDPTTCSWQNPRTVSLKITFTDEAAGKAKGKKGTVVDKFSLTNLSVRGATLPVSGLKNLMGGNIVLR